MVIGVIKSTGFDKIRPALVMAGNVRLRCGAWADVGRSGQRVLDLLAKVESLGSGLQLGDKLIGRGPRI